MPASVLSAQLGGGALRLRVDGSIYVDEARLSDYRGDDPENHFGRSSATASICPKPKEIYSQIRKKYCAKS